MSGDVPRLVIAHIFRFMCINIEAYACGGSVQTMQYRVGNSLASQCWNVAQATIKLEDPKVKKQQGVVFKITQFLVFFFLRVSNAV